MPYFLSDLTNANFNRADFSNSMLLRSAKSFSCSIDGAHFNYANLKNTTFEVDTLDNVDFTHIGIEIDGKPNQDNHLLALGIQLQKIAGILIVVSKPKG